MPSCSHCYQMRPILQANLVSTSVITKVSICKLLSERCIMTLRKPPPSCSGPPLAKLHPRFPPFPVCSIPVGSTIGARLSVKSLLSDTTTAPTVARSSALQGPSALSSGSIKQQPEHLLSTEKRSISTNQQKVKNLNKRRNWSGAEPNPDTGHSTIPYQTSRGDHIDTLTDALQYERRVAICSF